MGESKVYVNDKYILSIIVPVYNVDKFLERGIDSLLKFEENYCEIILVDDGSRDKSGFICDEYARNYKNIYVIHQQNHGVSSARNTGLKNAKGEYIAFFDPDDYISETFYSRMLQEMQAKKLDIVFSGYTVENIEGEGKKVNEERLKHISDGMDPKNVFVELDKSSASMAVVWRSLFRKNIIFENRIFFDEELTLNEDQIFLLDYLNYCSVIDYMQEYGYHYCMNMDSATGKLYKPNLLQERMKYVERMMTLLKKTTNSNDEILINRIKYKTAKEIISNEMKYNRSEKKFEELRKYLGKYFLPMSVIRQLLREHNGMKTNIIILLAKINCYKIIYFLYGIKTKI